MPKFGYTQKKTMPAREGVNYATEYYKQNLTEYSRLRSHVYRVAAELMSQCDSNSEYHDWAIKPLKGYRRTGGRKNYTPMEIVTDMVEQFTHQKDVPSGMLGRWNRLFGDTEWDIEMVSYNPARENMFAELMESGDGL